MSKNNEVIYNITEHFAQVESMIELGPIIILLGNYLNNNGNRIELGDTDIYLEYDYISHLTNINWNNLKDYNIDGISIIKIRDGMNRVPINEKLENFDFLYFDIISTNSIGTLSQKNVDRVENKSVDRLENQSNNSSDFGGFTISKLLKKIKDNRIKPVLIFEKDKKRVLEEINNGADLFYKITVTKEFPDKDSTFKKGDIFYNVMKKNQQYANKKLDANDYDELPEQDRKMLEYYDIELYEKNIVEKFANLSENLPGIEICKTTFGKLDMYNRTNIIVDGRCEINMNNFIINNNLFQTNKSRTYKGELPKYYNICIDTNKTIDIPFCPMKFEKCWIKNEYQLGFCYDPKTNTTFKTNCYDKECNEKEFKKIGNLNTWWELPGSGRGKCRKSSSSSIKSINDIDVNNLSGRTMIDLNEESKVPRNMINKIYNIQEKIDKQKLDLKENEKQYKMTKGLIDYNKAIINKKLKLLNNRDRQLEISIDSNIYWKKILYVLLALLMVIILILLFFSTILKKDN